MPTRLVPYTDAGGARHWVEVESTTAQALDLFDRAMRARERAWRRRVRVATDVRAERERRPRKERSGGTLRGFLNVELETAYRIMSRVENVGNPWEGPRVTFSHLLGESPTWPPPGCVIDREAQGVRRRRGRRLVCAFCAGRRLEPHQCCLGCDRSGQAR